MSLKAGRVFPSLLQDGLTHCLACSQCPVTAQSQPQVVTAGEGRPDRSSDSQRVHQPQRHLAGTRSLPFPPSGHRPASLGRTALLLFCPISYVKASSVRPLPLAFSLVRTYCVLTALWPLSLPSSQGVSFCGSGTVKNCGPVSLKTAQARCYGIRQRWECPQI